MRCITYIPYKHFLISVSLFSNLPKTAIPGNSPKDRNNPGYPLMKTGLQTDTLLKLNSENSLYKSGLLLAKPFPSRKKVLSLLQNYPEMSSLDFQAVVR